MQGRNTGRSLSLQRVGSAKWLGLVIVAMACSAGYSQTKEAAPASAPAVATAAASVQTSNGSQPGQPTAPTAATAQKIAALPQPFPPGLIQGIDVPAQSQKILNHLGEVVRYYRMAVVPIQKVGEPSDFQYAEQTQTEATQIGQLAFRAARSQAGFLIRIQARRVQTGRKRPLKRTAPRRYCATFRRRLRNCKRRTPLWTSSSQQPGPPNEAL